MKNLLLVLMVFLGGLLIFGCITNSDHILDDDKNQTITACTEEAMLCPNGGAVGRTGPNCTFAPCPDCTCPEGYEQEGAVCNPVCYYSDPPCLAPSIGCSSGMMVGNDSDEHGCKASAGYSWCEESQKCIRPWEEECGDLSTTETCSAYVNCTSDMDSCETAEVNCQCSYTNCTGEECMSTNIMCIEGYMCNANKQECDVPFDGRTSVCYDEVCHTDYFDCANGYVWNDFTAECEVEIDENCTIEYTNCAYDSCDEPVNCTGDETYDGETGGSYSLCEGDECLIIFVQCAEDHVWSEAENQCVLLKDENIVDTLNQTTCEEVGGTWDQCAPPEGCLECESCNPTCLCNEENGDCPSGYECVNDYYDTGSDIWVCDQEGDSVSSDTLDETTCEAANGHWNECGSACRGAAPDTLCTMQCVQYCECGGFAGFGCPEDYYCTDYLPEGAADAMGICKPLTEEY